jgi:hypothetical protein
MQKLDLKKDLRHLYNPRANTITIVDVPAMKFIMIDGAIEPSRTPGTSAMFQDSISALYGAAYTLKFAAKLRKQDPLDYPVMALEGLWWAQDGVFDVQGPGDWKYTLMIMKPDQVTSAMFNDALAHLRKKKGDQPAFDRLRLARFREGKCVQAMHIGPYADEPATVARMQAFLKEHGLRDLVGAGGRHHEIYLGDPRRADPSKLKTVLRHPVAKA